MYDIMQTVKRRGIFINIKFIKGGNRCIKKRFFFFVTVQGERANSAGLSFLLGSLAKMNAVLSFMMGTKLEIR